MTYTKKMIVTVLPPFHFNLSCEIFTNGDKQIRKYENGKFWQVIRTNGALILATIEDVGNFDKAKVSVELESNREITAQNTTKAKKIIRKLLSLDLDLKPFYETVKDDKIMANLTHKLWGLKIPTTQTVFEALVDSIVEQQISLRVANTIENRIIKNFGNTLDLDGNVFYKYPTPYRLASISIKQFRQCGLSLRKSEYIKETSRLIKTGKLNLEKLKNCESSEQIIRELSNIRGIGAWTAELTMLRGMERLEVLPADDLGLRRVISRYYYDGKGVSSTEARRIAKNWGEWKGLAAYYLLVADMKDVEI